MLWRARCEDVCDRSIARPAALGCHRRIRRIGGMANWLLPSAVVVSSLLLCAGLTAALYDIEQHGWGLYLILVSLVSFMMISAFCLVGTEQQKETIAHQFWESTRHTVRKYTPMLTMAEQTQRKTSKSYFMPDQLPRTYDVDVMNSCIRQAEGGGALLTLASAASINFQQDQGNAHVPLELNFLAPSTTVRETTVSFASSPSPEEEDEEEEVQL